MNSFVVLIIAATLLAFNSVLNLIYYNIRDKQTLEVEKAKGDKKVYLTSVLLSATGMLLVIYSMFVR